MSAKIYVCGEVVADLLEKNAGSGDFKLTLGGTAFFSAIGAQKLVRSEGLDVGVGFVGPLSNDNFGGRFFDGLVKAGISTEGVTRVDRNTTLAIVAIQPGKENGFTFYGRGSAEEMTRRDELPQKLSGDHKICCFGSISTVIEPARHAWLQFANEQKQDSLIYYDLNTRPSIAKNPRRYRGIVAEWAAAADIVKASDADIAWAYPGKTTRQVADLWLKAGAAVAVFTRGGAGSEAFMANGKTATAPAPRLKVAGTVGAGDNFNAGFAGNLAKEGVFSREAVLNLGEGQLTRVLSGANQAAANHLISIGARPVAVRHSDKTPVSSATP